MGGQTTDLVQDVKPAAAIKVLGRSIDPKWYVLAATGLGSFASSLSSNIITTVLPVVSDALGSDVATIEWVVTVYVLVVAGTMLSFGRLGDLRGQKPLYLFGLGTLMTGATLSGFAPTAWALVGFRAIQALGAAMMFASALAILTKIFPATQRGRAIGMNITLTYLGLTIGPSLGGLLVTQWSWRAAFFVNLPIGLLALLLTLRFVPDERRIAQPGRFDIPGATTFTAGLVMLLLGLNQGHAWGWTSPAVVVSGLTGLLLLTLFVVIEARTPSPMLNLDLFQNRTFCAATASAIINYVAVFGLFFLLPFYLIQGRGLSPAQSGLLLTAQPLLMVIIAPISGTLSDRIGSRPLAVAGNSILAVGLFVLSSLRPQSPLSHVVIGLAIVGVGVGLFTAPNNSALMGSAPRHRQGTAAGVVATARSVGMALGIGIAGAIFTTLLTHSQSADLATTLAEAMDISLLAMAGLAVVGAMTSAVREGFRPAEPGMAP